MKHASSIQRKLKIMGGLFSIAIFAIIFLSVAIHEVSKKDSLIINIAGKQRMLTQRMSKELFFLRHKDEVDFRTLNNSIELFSVSLDRLRFGDESKQINPPRSKQITDKLTQVHDIWVPFKENLILVQEKMIKVKPFKDSLIERNQNLLSLSDGIVKLMVEAGLDGHYIDLSGRQRMLSQRMGLYLERYFRTNNQQDYLRYLGARELFEKTLESFVNDSKLSAKTILKTHIDETYQYWQEYKNILDYVLGIEKEINRIIEFLYNENVRLLDSMDDAVWMMTEESERNAQLFVNFQYFALVLMLIIVFYGYFMAKNIIRSMREFIEKAKHLADTTPEELGEKDLSLIKSNEDELEEASSHIRTFIRKVNTAMAHSQEAIDQVEKTLNDLQGLTENMEVLMREYGIDEKEKTNLDRHVNKTEDIAIESTENLLHVSKMLNKIKNSLEQLQENKTSIK